MRQRIVMLAARPEFWLLGLLAWLLVSACRSLDTPPARAAFTEALRWGIGISLTLTLGRTLRRTGIALRGLTLAAGALALAGVWDGFRADRGGVVGPYHDHQLYGSALLALLPFAVALALTAREPLWRLAGQAIASAAGICLILSQTRSAWAGLLAAAVVFGGLWLRQSTEAHRRRAALLVWAGAVPATLLSVFVLTAQTDLRAPLASRTATLSHLSGDQSWQTRLTMWRGAARMAAAHPLMGIGLGHYPGEQSAWTGQGHPLLSAERPSLSEEAHDFYLQTAAETGLTGLLLYGAVLVSFTSLGLHFLGRPSRRTDRHTALVIACLAMLAGQAVDALASPSWQFAEVSLLFWAALGVGLAALRRKELEIAPVRFPVSVRRATQYAVSGAAAVLLVAQTLPWGLLSPVEAYNHQNTVTYTRTTISQVTTGCPSGVLCFALSAAYSDGASHDVTLDSGIPSTPSSFACQKLTSGGVYVTCSSTFGSSSTRNRLTIASAEHGASMKITGSFSDNTYSGATFQSTTRHTSNNTVSLTAP